MALEEEFECEIPDEEAEKITTVQQAVDSSIQKLGQQIPFSQRKFRDCATL